MGITRIYAQGHSNIFYALDGEILASVAHIEMIYARIFTNLSSRYLDSLEGWEVYWYRTNRNEGPCSTQQVAEQFIIDKLGQITGTIRCTQEDLMEKFTMHPAWEERHGKSDS